jgi:hypothetical protein
MYKLKYHFMDVMLSLIIEGCAVFIILNYSEILFLISIVIM